VQIFPDLIGFRPVAPNQTIDWARVFDAPWRPAAARAKKIDGRLVSALIALPVALTGDVEVQESIRLLSATFNEDKAPGFLRAKLSRAL